jgi:ubiquinone/menaquinone biosynthesis C-methylase UbiE
VILLKWKELLSAFFGGEVSASYEAQVEQLVVNGSQRDEIDSFLDEYSEAVGVVFNILMLSRSGLNVADFKRSIDFLLGRERVAEEVVKHVEAKSNVLEVGCGLGQVSLILDRKGYRVFGVDVSEKVIEAANRAARTLGSGAKFQVVRDGILPFQNQYFDAVVFASSIHEIKREERSGLLREVGRAIKPNGKLLVIDQEDVTPFDSIRNEVNRIGFLLLLEEELQPVFDHGKTSKVLIEVFSRE